jgi:hypothetical protein
VIRPLLAPILCLAIPVIPYGPPVYPSAAAVGQSVGSAKPSKPRPKLDDYQVPAGTPLMIQLRTPLDSASSQIEDAVRATLTDAVTQDGVELIPKGSTLHGRVTDVLAASKQNRIGRLAFGFHVIEHVETHSLATIQARAVSFEATLAPKEKFRDVQVPADERLLLTLSSPLLVHIPRSR